MSAFLFLLVLPFSGEAIYNLKTSKKLESQNVESKHWLLIAQGCHSCSEVLVKLEKFCSGKRPSPLKIGFFITGSNKQVMLNKLKAFEKGGYEVFTGSTAEFYSNYQLLGSPSLKIKGKNKSVMGKNEILHFLKQDSTFC